MEGEMKKVLELYSSAIASLCYCYYVSSRIPKGKYRLISLLPVISLFTLLPLRFTYALPAIIAAFYLVWIANFRLLFFAFDLGPLSPDPDPKSLPHFILLACFPLKIGQTLNPPPAHPPRKLSKLILNLPTEALLLLLGTSFACRYMEEILVLNPIMKTGFYWCLDFLMLEVLIGSGSVAAATIGFVIDPAFDEPFFSTSLQDFWGKRWNLVITNHLRATVFEPVKAALRPVMGRKWAGMIGVFSVFLVSGLMHELMFYYPNRVKPTWGMTGFFVLHGLCVILEFHVKRALAGRLRLHWAVSVFLTIGFVLVTGCWLFVPTVTRFGLDQRIVSEPFIFFNYLESVSYKIVDFLTLN